VYKSKKARSSAFGNYARAIGTALALTGTGLIFCGGRTGAISIHPDDKTTEVSPSVQRSAKQRNELFRSLEVFKSRMEKIGQMQARPSVSVPISIADEFPYQSMDCSLVPLDRSPVKSNGNPETFFSSIPSHLEEEISRLKTYGNIEGLRSMIAYLSSLNLEWGKGDSENLYGLYSSLEMGAKTNGWDKSPDPSCVSRILCAMKTLFRAEEVLGDILAKSPKQAESVLSDLPEAQKERVILSSAIDLLYSEKFDASSLQDLLASLSLQNTDSFLRVLNSFLVNDHETITRLNSIAIKASNPYLRMALNRIVEKWMRQILEWQQNGVLSSEPELDGEICEEED
jgi:hypothetical protein